MKIDTAMAGLCLFTLVLSGCEKSSVADRIKSRAEIHKKEIAAIQAMNISEAEKEKRRSAIEMQMAREMDDIRNGR